MARVGEWRRRIGAQFGRAGALSLLAALALGVGSWTSAWNACAQVSAEVPVLDAAEVKRQLSSGARRGLLFELTKGERRAYLFGTLHLGKPGLLPLDAEVMRAVGQVGTIAVEVDVTDAARMQAAVERSAMYPDGRSLADDLSAADLVQVEAWLVERGIPRAQAIRMRPWMLNATLVVVEAQRLGLIPGLGADVVLLGVARAARKPVRELETIDEQFAALGAGSAQQQAADLAELIQSLRSGQEIKDLGALVDAWFAADLGALEAGFDKMKNDPRPSAQRSFEEVVVGRNRRIAERLDALAGDGPVLAAVGALHLVGTGSVVEELGRMGWAVTRR